MKAIHHLYAAAAALVALTACSDIDDSLSAFRNDPNAVRITAQVGSVSGNFETRSNPIGTEEQQKKFNEGDEVSVAADGQDAVVYRCDANGEWVPQQGDKYLKWESTSMHFQAFYPATFTGTVDQPTAYGSIADLQAADYMKFAGQQDNSDGNSLHLQMARQMARVVVEIAGFGNEYAEGTVVNGVQVWANGASASAYLYEGKYYALMKPCSADDNSLFLALTVGTNSKPEQLHGVPELQAGMSYTYRLTVGKNKLELNSVSVEPWNDDVIPGGKAYLAPDISGNVITMHEAGTLTASDVTEALDTGHALKIVGPMNKNDFSVLGAYLRGLGITEEGTPIDIDLADAEVETIPDEAFRKYKYSLGNVALPKSVKTIGEGAFYSCEKLNVTNWNQLTNLTMLGRDAFSGSGLKDDNVILPDQVKQIGQAAFGRTGVKSISFPNNVTLNSSCCYYCDSLETVTFRGDVTFQGKSSQFGYCSSLTLIDLSHSTTVPDAKREEQTSDIGGGPSTEVFDIFDGTTCSNVTLKVPAGMKQEFIDKGWTGFTIVEQ